jgi:hypothetical protein
MMTAGSGRWQIGGRTTMTALSGWSIAIAIAVAAIIGAANAEVVAIATDVVVHVGGNAVQRVLTITIKGRGHVLARGFIRRSNSTRRKYLQYRGIVAHGTRSPRMQWTTRRREKTRTVIDMMSRRSIVAADAFDFVFILILIGLACILTCIWID